MPDDLQIRLKKGGSHYLWLARHEKNNGTFTRKLHPRIEPGSDYTIEIRSASREEIGDESDSPFSIVAPLMIAYVDKRATGKGDGRSWTDAAVTIQAALDLEPAEVWIAAGTYPEGIVPPSDVALYGGFAGGESELSERNPQVNRTLIDGSGASIDAPVYHVVVLDGVTNTRLDGLIIAGGIADGHGNDGKGSGVFCKDVDSTVVIANCVVTGNSANEGGGIFLQGSSPEISGCVIVDNKASAGGGLYCYAGSSPVVTATLFANNGGYAVYEHASSPDGILAGCLFHENPDGDYFDNGTVGYTGADSINALVAGASDNADVLEMIDVAYRGAWTAPPNYDPIRNRTTFTDTFVFLEPSTLVGQIINPRSTEQANALIVGNTAGTIEVLNDWAGWVAEGDAYEIGGYEGLLGPLREATSGAEGGR